jgi:hypothetical protein
MCKVRRFRSYILSQFHMSRLMLNISAHADTQQQVAAARRLLRADGLQRYGALK